MSIVRYFLRKPVDFHVITDKSKLFKNNATYSITIYINIIKLIETLNAQVDLKLQNPGCNFHISKDWQFLLCKILIYTKYIHFYTCIIKITTLPMEYITC